MSSEHINKKGDGPNRGFGYLSLYSDPIDLAAITVILQFSTGSRYKDYYIPNEVRYKQIKCSN